MEKLPKAYVVGMYVPYKERPTQFCLIWCQGYDTFTKAFLAFDDTSKVLGLYSPELQPMYCTHFDISNTKKIAIALILAEDYDAWLEIQHANNELWP